MKGLLPKVSDEHVPKVFYLQVVVEVVAFTEGASLLILFVYNMHIRRVDTSVAPPKGSV